MKKPSIIVGAGYKPAPTHLKIWRRLPDSNRRITVLQTVALTPWLSRQFVIEKDGLLNGQSLACRPESDSPFATPTGGQNRFNQYPANIQLTFKIRPFSNDVKKEKKRTSPQWMPGTTGSMGVYYSMRGMYVLKRPRLEDILEVRNIFFKIFHKTLKNKSLTL